MREPFKAQHKTPSKNPSESLLKSLLRTPFLRTSLGGSQKGWFPKGWFWRMFPSTKKPNEGTFGCSPAPKNGTKVHSDVSRYRKMERGYIRQNHPFTKLPFCFLSTFLESCVVVRPLGCAPQCSCTGSRQRLLRFRELQGQDLHSDRAQGGELKRVRVFAF